MITAEVRGSGAEVEDEASARLLCWVELAKLGKEGAEVEVDHGGMHDLGTEQRNMSVAYLWDEEVPDLIMHDAADAEELGVAEKVNTFA